MRITFFIQCLLMIGLSATQSCAQKPENAQQKANAYTLSESEWKQKLSAEEYRVLREKGTERPYSGEYEEHYEAGVYVCKGCNAPLFSSSTKFDAGCGWPSFYNAVEKSGIREVPDYSHGMQRIEVQCARCGGHLGHVFPDGPKPTGLRYCINSVSLGFVKAEDKK
jgi:peptide-methionine (R)-S-oxide reductase